jgi:glyoxylase-like metal-dependent hydrolase (beta-lactamase superfamily II)
MHAEEPELMLRIEMLPARQGDALWIEYGEDPQRPHRVLCDAGTPGTWPVVQARIADLPEGQRAFELLVVSHVDADHIGGSLPLLTDTRLGATFDDVWFNGWRHLPQRASRSDRCRESS